MELYNLKEIADIIGEKFIGNSSVDFFKIITDSRQIGSFEKSLFIAISGTQHDGHKYIDTAYSLGVRAFVISKFIDTSQYPEAGFIFSDNSIQSLQKIASYKRSLYTKPIIAITGSNGKTIIKEWLHWILSPYYKIIRSPKSYNSQIGVPLSLWLLNNDSDFAIIEAGISKEGEMEALANIIKPDIGIITNIGTAHQSNFSSIEQKAAEKMKLLENCKIAIINADCQIINSQIDNLKHVENIIKWSNTQSANVKAIEINVLNSYTRMIIEYRQNYYNLNIPFTDKGSIQNAIICFSTIIAVNPDIDLRLIKRFSSLPIVKMRLETFDGLNNSIIINDSYNSDINSLEIALDYLNEKKVNKQSVLILSDILQNNENETELSQSIANIIKEKKIDYFIGIGKFLSNYQLLFPLNSKFYIDTDNFLENYSLSQLHDKAVLIKGARNFKFEKISKRLQQKNHLSVIETDLSLMRHNLLYFKSLLPPTTKLMVMVKAFSYGSGYREIAAYLQHNRIDYMSVAFIDEGTELRNYGIETPIIVMNPNIQSLQTMIEHNLEAEIYSINLLKELVKELKDSNITQFPIHIKLDTGMHRLGFINDDITEMCNLILKSGKIEVASIFSHLVGSESKDLDYFTHQQVELFNMMYDKIVSIIGKKPIKHIVNSAGIIRFPEYHFDMVRLGIGLYGLISELSSELVPVAQFKSAISQIHSVSKDETISYNRSGKLTRDSLIATIPVGYADGLDRRLGNGNWYFMLNSYKVPTVGNICMDMCMIDVTDCGAKEGDEVIIYGPQNSINKMADILNTIPYEIITSISQRVKRIYYEE